MNKNAWYVQVLIFSFFVIVILFCYRVAQTCVGEMHSPLELTKNSYYRLPARAYFSSTKKSEVCSNSIRQPLNWLAFLIAALTLDIS